MKTTRIVTLTLIATLLIAGMAEARGRNRMNCQAGTRAKAGTACSVALASLPIEDLSDTEQASLVLMREEEKLARDVYVALGQKYDLPIFASIPRSEQRHMDQMGLLLERYGLDDPVVSGQRGQFADGKMQALYDELVATGSQSEADALRVGALIEDLDIHDLQQALAGDVDNADIRLVYENLVRGSRNHLRAFTRQLKLRGVDYEARYIAQSDLETILAADWERGQMAGQGRGGRHSGKNSGQGRGQGRGPGFGQDKSWARCQG